jgi:putative FmdB family regulatory protein
MPFYQYKCNICKQEFKCLHGAEEKATECKHCNSPDIVKLISKIQTSVNSNKNSTAGERVEKFIEESRETLKQQLEDARKELKI